MHRGGVSRIFATGVFPRIEKRKFASSVTSGQIILQPVILGRVGKGNSHFSLSLVHIRSIKSKLFSAILGGSPKSPVTLAENIHCSDQVRLEAYTRLGSHSVEMRDLAHHLGVYPTKDHETGLLY